MYYGWCVGDIGAEQVGKIWNPTQALRKTLIELVILEGDNIPNLDIGKDHEPDDRWPLIRSLVMFFLKDSTVDCWQFSKHSPPVYSPMSSYHGPNRLGFAALIMKRSFFMNWIFELILFGRVHERHQIAGVLTLFMIKPDLKSVKETFGSFEGQSPDKPYKWAYP